MLRLTRKPLSHDCDIYPPGDEFDDSKFVAGARTIAIPGAGSRPVLKKIERFDFENGKRATIESSLDSNGLKLAWSGNPVTDGRVLWLAVWDPLDDADVTKPPEPRRWFQLGPVTDQPSRFYIKAAYLPPRRGSGYGYHVVLSRP